MCVCVYKMWGRKERERERERERNVAIIRYVKMTLLYVSSTIIRAAAMQKHTKKHSVFFCFLSYIIFVC